MGSKYKPTTKDRKASLRFHQNAGRSGAARKSMFITSNPGQHATKVPGAKGPGLKVSEPPRE
jgi:hypothetical protein